VPRERLDEIRRRQSADARDQLNRRIRPGLQRELDDELSLPATLLLGDQPETFAEADRLRAESELRIATVVPLGSVAILLALTTSPWWLSPLPGLTVLLLLGIRRDVESRSLIAAAIRIRKVNRARLRDSRRKWAALRSRSRSASQASLRSTGVQRRYAYRGPTCDPNAMAVRREAVRPSVCEVEPVGELV
jgi:hypothetical protein